MSGVVADVIRWLAASLAYVHGLERFAELQEIAVRVFDDHRPDSKGLIVKWAVKNLDTVLSQAVDQLFDTPDHESDFGEPLNGGFLVVVVWDILSNVE
jgi:hypothetical protein